MSAYCSADLVKVYSQVAYNQLGFTSTELYGSFLAGTVIPSMQKTIDNYVNHNFLDNSGTIKLNGNGKDVLPVPSPYVPIKTLTSVKVDDVDVTSEIKAYPAYLALGSGVFTEDTQNVEVVLSYGYDSVPEDIQFVCAEMAAKEVTELLRRKVTPDVVARLIMRDDDVKELPSFGRSGRVLTPELQEILNRYVYSNMDVT